MKKALPVCLCLVSFTVAHAEFSLGLDFLTNVHVDRAERQNEEERTTSFTFGVSPKLIILANDRLEIVPNIGFLVATSKTVIEELNQPDRELPREDDWRFWAGCGLFWRLIESSMARLSLGPDVTVSGGDNNTGIPDGFMHEFEFSIGMPINIDFLLSDRLFFRMSPRFAEMSFGVSDEGNRDRSTFDFDIRTYWVPRFGFYLNL